MGRATKLLAKEWEKIMGVHPHHTLSLLFTLKGCQLSLCDLVLMSVSPVLYKLSHSIVVLNEGKEQRCDQPQPIFRAVLYALFSAIKLD